MSIFLKMPPESWIAQNDLAFAIFDGYPVSCGHALVITKRVVDDWWSANEAERVALMSLVNEVREIIESRYSPDGFNIGINCGEAAGQTVLHLHVHLIPRYLGDVEDARGGVRHVIPAKGNYLTQDY